MAPIFTRPGSRGKPPPGAPPQASMGRPFPTLPSRTAMTRPFPLLHRCLALLLPLSVIPVAPLHGVAPAPEASWTVAPTDPGDREEALAAIFRNWDSTRTPGCALGVETADGARLTRAWGMADLEGGLANTPATVFEAGSVSKQFTVAAVVLLALEGRLSLEDDIREHIPEVPDFGETIRLHHLVHHTSGLRDWGSVAAISGWGRGARTHDHGHVLEIVGRQRALNYPPGFEYAYSNTGFNLLAMVVERVTGESFAGFSTRRIFEPLGLTHTQWRDDYTRLVPGRSSAYAPITGGGYRIDRPIEHVHGNGGLLTTVDDLLRWDAALRVGSHGLGGQAFVELMHRAGVLTSGRTIHYAGGLMLGELDGVREVAHTGSTAGYRAFLGRYPEQGVAVALLCNGGDVNPGQVGRDVARVYLDRGDGAPGDAPGVEGPDRAVGTAGVSLSPASLAARSGLFRNARTGDPVRLRVEEGVLRWEGFGVLVPLSSTEFRVDGEPGSPERRLVFQEAPHVGMAAASPGEAASPEGTASPEGAASPGEAASPERAAPSEGGEPDRLAFRVVEDGWEGDLYLPTRTVDPSTGELRAFTGTFTSDEAETGFRIALEGEGLVLHRRPDTRLPLTPLYPDAFQVPGLGRLVFLRDDGGRVVALSVQQARVYDLRFSRRPGD
jgi:CubicO group peptidase (beta-lactamase class C family)